MTKEGIEANLEVIAHDVFDDCIGDIEQYITDSIYNRAVSGMNLMHEFLIMQKQVFKSYLQIALCYTHLSSNCHYDSTIKRFTHVIATIVTLDQTKYDHYKIIYMNLNL